MRLRVDYTKPKIIGYRNTIWRAAEAIGAGYKKASQDHLSPFWVLRYLVKTFGRPNHERLADIVLEKIKQMNRKEQKEILIEAFAQAAAESRKATETRLAANLNEDGWNEVAAILRDNERPAIAKVTPKDKDAVVSLVPCVCRNHNCAGNCGGTCGCERCARTSLLRDRIAAREAAAG